MGLLLKRRRQAGTISMSDLSIGTMALPLPSRRPISGRPPICIGQNSPQLSTVETSARGAEVRELRALSFLAKCQTIALYSGTEGYVRSSPRPATLFKKLRWLPDWEVHFSVIGCQKVWGIQGNPDRVPR